MDSESKLFVLVQKLIVQVEGHSSASILLISRVN